MLMYLHFTQHFRSLLQKLQQVLEECKPMLDTVNEQGPQLSALTPGEGATRVDDIIARDNNKFSSAAEKIKGHADRLKMQRSKSAEVIFVVSVVRRFVAKDERVHVDPLISAMRKAYTNFTKCFRKSTTFNRRRYE